MKNTRGEPSAGGQTAPRETLPISCLFVLFRSLRVVRAANIVTMDKPAFVGFGMAFSHPHLRSENDEGINVAVAVRPRGSPCYISSRRQWRTSHMMRMSSSWMP